jgi:hypothetical protein
MRTNLRTALALRAVAPAAADRISAQTYARQLASRATNHVGRDNGGCPGSGASPTCSTTTFEFTNFKGFYG